MSKRKKTYYFSTIQQLHAIPLDKVAAFCEDLRLWLSVSRAAEREGFTMNTQTDVFGWIDDGKHDVRISVTVKEATPDPARVQSDEPAQGDGSALDLPLSLVSQDLGKL